MAASATDGMYCSGPVRNSSTGTSAAAATSPATWVRAPAASATAVRRAEPVTVKLCDRAAATFAAPSAAISRSASMS